MEGKMGWSVADAVDYKGFPADRSATGGWVPAALILGIEICERLSTMGIAVNLVTYLVSSMHLPSAESANIVTDFMGTSFLLCLLGGFLADSFLGRYLTIAFFSVLQALVSPPSTDAAYGLPLFRLSLSLKNIQASMQGTGMLSLATRFPQLRPPPCNSAGKCHPANGKQMGILYLSLYLIALGTGGLKSSVSGFGTDQFDENDGKEKAQMAYFFNRFFFFVSMGTLLAVTVLVYIQDEVARSWAYGICSISMLIAILVFLSGTRRYRYKKSSGSPIVHISQVVVAAVKKRKLRYPAAVSSLYQGRSDAPRIQHTNQFCFLDKAAIVAEGDYEKNNVPNPWKLCSVSRIEEVKMMIRLLPIWTTTIIFWTTYAQMITFSVEQAATMERSIGSFQIPAASLTIFFVGAILITLAVYDRVIMPLCRKWAGKQGLSNLQRMGLGLVLSTLGMAVAAVVEVKRLSVAKKVGPSSSSTTLPITVFVLIPQFFLVGSGEAFIYTGQLDFFITRSPKGMKTMSTGLFLSTLSLGFFVSSFLVSIVKGVTAAGKDGKGWLADNINDGRLDYFYGLLAVLGFLNLVAYLVCAAWSKPQRPAAGDDGLVEMETTNQLSADDKC